MMCSANDDPTTYDIPEPRPPRRLVSAGDRPPGRGSVALAVLGEMLTEWEAVEIGHHGDPCAECRTSLVILREARNRVAEAESRDSR